MPGRPVDGVEVLSRSVHAATSPSDGLLLFEFEFDYRVFGVILWHQKERKKERRKENDVIDYLFRWDF